MIRLGKYARKQIAKILSMHYSFDAQTIDDLIVKTGSIDRTVDAMEYSAKFNIDIHTAIDYL